MKQNESPNTSLDEIFWNEKYNNNDTGWDLGEVSPPLKAYIDQLSNKNLHILIPGCGNCYEAEYLLQQGFTNITIIDLASAIVERLQKVYIKNKNVKIILGDLFTHSGTYDLILEQTFFCALHPSLRKDYVTKMNNLLDTNGKLVGVLFNRSFPEDGPPFGGSTEEYLPLFKNTLQVKTFAACYNSFIKRQGTETFFIAIRK